MKRVLGLPPHKITKVYTFLQSLDEEQFKKDYSKMKYKELSKKISMLFKYYIKSNLLLTSTRKITNKSFT